MQAESPGVPETVDGLGTNGDVNDAPMESTFKDQINPKRQTAGPHKGGLTGTGPRVVQAEPAKAQPDAETAPLLARWVVLPSTYHPAL